MNELNKWSVGKKVGTILVAREMATSTEETFAYLDMLHKGENLRDFPAPRRARNGWLCTGTTSAYSTRCSTCEWQRRDSVLYKNTVPEAAKGQQKRDPQLLQVPVVQMVAGAGFGVSAAGSDDGVIVWLNGKQVHKKLVGRGYSSKADRVPIHLKKGRNKLLLKITQGGGGWAFGAHILDKDGDPIEGLRYTVNPDD